MAIPLRQAVQLVDDLKDYLQEVPLEQKQKVNTLLEQAIAIRDEMLNDYEENQ